MNNNNNNIHPDTLMLNQLMAMLSGGSLFSSGSNGDYTREELRARVDTDKMVEAMVNAPEDSFLIFRRPQRHPLIFVPLRDMGEKVYVPAFLDSPEDVFVGQIADLGGSNLNDALNQILHIYQGSRISYGDVVVLKTHGWYASYMAQMEGLGYENYPDLLD